MAISGRRLGALWPSLSHEDLLAVAGDYPEDLMLDSTYAENLILVNLLGFF